VFIALPKGLILFYTVYGNTEKAAQAICEGLKEGGVEAECRDMRKVKPEELAMYDILVFGSPTHMESIPNDVKTFMKRLRKQDVKGKRGAAFDTRYEDAKVGALKVLEDRMRELGITILRSGLPVLLPSWAAKGPLKEGELTKCKEVGRILAQAVKV